MQPEFRPLPQDHFCTKDKRTITLFTGPISFVLYLCSLKKSRLQFMNKLNQPNQNKRNLNLFFYSVRAICPVYLHLN